MKTEELISNLTNHLKPVKQIHSDKKTFFICFLIILSISTVLIFYLSQNFQFYHIPNRIYKTLFLFSLCYYSFNDLIKISSPTKSFSLMIIPFLILFEFSFLLFGYFFPSNHLIEYEYHNCIEDFILFYILFFMFSLFFLIKRFPTEIFKASIISATMESSISSFCLLILCPNEEVTHLLEFHFSVMLLGILVSSIIKYFILKIYFKRKLSFY